MEKITAYNIVHAISELPRSKNYNYINPKTTTLLKIDSVTMPAGPITVKRWSPSKGETSVSAKPESISQDMIWRVANAITEGSPINLDRILGASYNTRSALETLIALTPEFYFCYPGRIQDINGKTSIEQGHKHLIWLPKEPHAAGVLTEKKIENMEISEIPVQSVTYDELILPESVINNSEIDIDVARRHTQIQIALYMIGQQLGYRTWIASNDQGTVYNDKPIMEYPNIVPSLRDDNLLSVFPNAPKSAALIDCIWFKNHRLMPAVMEVEHTTGVTSGLTRMQGLMETIPAIKTRYVIVAPDEDREKVITEINRPQFYNLDAKYFPYSSVEELLWLCEKRDLHGVTEQFLDCYMENVREDHLTVS